jgi:hypothetical protein
VLTLRLGAVAALSGPPIAPAYTRVDADGVLVESAMGPDGDHLFTYGAHGSSHLSSDAAALRCAVLDGGSEWERGLAVAVLGQVSALAGNVVLDGSATRSQDGALVMVGHAVSVSAIATTLARRGHDPLSLGAVALRCDGDGIAVHAGPGAPAACEPVPLRAILVVEHVSGSSSLMFAVPESIPALMEAWVVPHGRLDRAERRATGFEQVACTAPVYCLLAGEDAQPARLADTVTSRRWPPNPLRTSSSRSPTSA